MELRKDYILDKWVLIASNRKKRPNQFKQNKIEKKPKTDFFAPGNENLTPPEIYRYPKDSENWELRVVPNKFAAVEALGEAEIKTDNDFFTYSDAYGYHEVLIETPDDRQIWDLNNAELIQIFNAYKLRITDLLQDPKIKYVQIFKNSGKEAGTSILHSHSQIIAYNKLPENIKLKLYAVKKYGKDVYERIINIEKNSLRKCFENDNVIAFCPYASRYPFEVCIFPKDNVKDLHSLNENQLRDLVDILSLVLGKLKELNAPFNYVLNYAPDNQDLHFHIEVFPRLSKWAGFEIGTGDVINAVSPEQAAEFYRS